MKKCAAWLMVVVLLFALCACGEGNGAKETTEQPPEQTTEQPTEQTTEPPTEETTEQPTELQRVELVGFMLQEKDESTGYGGAWEFWVKSDSSVAVVYFVDGTDLEWYKHFEISAQQRRYYVTISAIQDGDGIYREAEIVEDTIRNATDEERLQNFGDYISRIALVITVPASGKAPMTADEIHAALIDKSFSVEDNDDEIYSTNSITFYENGVSKEYFSNEYGTEDTRLSRWSVEDGAFVMSWGPMDYVFDAYQFDNGRILLICIGNEYESYDSIEDRAHESMILTLITED